MQQPAQTILFVDDDVTVRMLAERALAKMGYECVTAASGEQALEIIDQVNPALVMLDIEMPGLDGFEICSSIRKHQRFGDTPILMVSGHDEIEYLNNAYDLGAIDLILKPINWKLLDYRIRYILGDQDGSNQSATETPRQTVDEKIA